MKLPDPETLLDSVQQTRQRHKKRHIIVRVLTAVTGGVLVLGGIGLVVLPGPAFLVIPLGLFLWALEFDWAERWLRRVVAYYVRTKEQASTASRGQRVAAVGLGALALGGFAAAAILWDLPYLPV